MRLIIELLQSDFAALWGAIIVGIAIGLIGAYARELNDGHRPSFKWFLNRILIYPFLSLAAATAADSTKLSMHQACFLAAILSLLSFDALRLITENFVKRAEALANAMDIAKPDRAIGPSELMPLRPKNKDGDEKPPE